MQKKLSLQNQFFLVVVAIALITLLIIWTVIRPKYETSVINERLTSVQQLQIYTIDNLDRKIMEWSDIARFVAWQVTEKPKEGEIVLRMIMTLHPEIVQIRITSKNLADELSSQNTTYAPPIIQEKEIKWVQSKIDTSLYIAWQNDDAAKINYFITKIYFQVQDNPFVITTTWDAKRLEEIRTGLPLGEDYYAGIQSRNAVLLQNKSPFNPIETTNADENLSTMKSVKQDNEMWRVLISAFKSAELWMIISVPERTIIKPVEDLFLYTSSFIVSLFFMVMVFGWFLTHQISRPIKRLIQDVQRLSNLDFTQPIQIPIIKDLRGMGETIELMRLVLEKYQRLNVDKIILEEWKNKLFMTHSADMIGLTDGMGNFIFRNEQLENFSSSLLPTRPIKSKYDLLTHPTISKIKETFRTNVTDMLEVNLAQSEIKTQVDTNASHYFRVNDLTIIRNGENYGSLLIFHDLTNERLIEKMKTDMINVVVHELRNPVGSIMGFAEIMLMDINISNEERREFLELILTSSKNLSSLINRFLEISRLESRRIEYPKISSDFTSIVKKVIETQKPQLLSKSITVELDITGDIPAITVSPDLMREAILNLLSNAIKYGNSNRVINISISIENEDVVFTITDHGYGIPPEAQEKLFTKFFRVYNPKASEEIGTGLGLAYVKEIAAYHGGSISLESNQEIGCKFTFKIPTLAHESKETL